MLNVKSDISHIWNPDTNFKANKNNKRLLDWKRHAFIKDSNDLGWLASNVTEDDYGWFFCAVSGIRK